jgi:two-component system, LuxR family, sensor kinase FixL
VLIAILGKGNLGKQMTLAHTDFRPEQDRGAQTSWSSSFAGRPNPTTSKYWLIGIVFLLVYSILSKLTAYHQLDGIGITLWSPYNGLSLLLLFESITFAPFVVLGAVIADVLVLHVALNSYQAVAVEAVLTIWYVGAAAFLRHKLKYDPKQITLSNVTKLLIYVPVFTAVSSFLYCGVLYLGGNLSSNAFVRAVGHFWIGDVIGITTVFSMAAAVFVLKRDWRWSRYTIISWSVFILGACVAFIVLIGSGVSNQYHEFYPLFLPIIWIGVREGYAGVSLALLIIELGLVASTMYMGSDVNDYFIFQILMLVLSVTGLLLGVVTSERRASARLLVEQQMELARISAHVNAGAMGMALAHELSQPLSTVSTYLHAARRLLKSGVTSERLMDTLTKAETEARRTREVLERIRDFVSNGKADLKPVDLPTIAKKIATLSRENAATHGIEVEIEGIRPMLPVKADRLQIEQVLNNLIINAIEAASQRPGGRGRVIVRLGARGNKVVIQVEDNGPGVVPEIAGRMFDAYQTTKPRGMGLGLHLSQQIVRSHGGGLWWEPDVPEGTRFVVELPIDGPDQNAF